MDIEIFIKFVSTEIYNGNTEGYYTRRTDFGTTNFIVAFKDVTIRVLATNPPMNIEAIFIRVKFE